MAPYMALTWPEVFGAGYKVANGGVEETRAMSNNQSKIEKPGQMKAGQAERLRELEAENARLRGEVAVLTVDKLILNEVVDENDRGSVRNAPPDR